MSAAFLILGLRAIGHNSPTTDEPGHYRYGHRILRGVAARWDDSKMPVSALNALPCWIAEKSGTGASDLDEFSGPCDWTLARVPTLIGGLVLGLSIASWSYALFGWAGALFSFGLFSFDPNLLAHSTLVTTDIFGALCVLLSLRAFVHWLKNPNAIQTALLGLAVGAAFISKYTAAYLPIIFLVAGGIGYRAKAAEPAANSRRLLGLAAVTAIAIAMINLGFLFDRTGSSLRDQEFESAQFRELRKVPLVASIPLPVPASFVEGLDRVFHRERNGGGSGNIYFLGELRSPGSEGFITYFAVVGFFKTPIPTLIVLLVGAWLHLSLGGPKWNADIITLMAAVLVFSLYFSFLFRAQIGFRHFLVTVPPLMVLSGVVGQHLARSRAGLAAAVLLTLFSAGSIIRHGDDPLSYFNEFISPTRTYEIAADSNLEWGQSRAAVDRYLAAHPNVLPAPGKPFPGRLIVSANQLTGVVTRRRLEWLRDSGIKPVDHVAFTHFLFDITRDQAEQLRRALGEPPLSER